MKSLLKFFLIILVLALAFDTVKAEETQVSEIFIKRHSGKSYDSNRFINDQQLLALFEAARWAPSSHNDQPWNFIVIDRIKNPESFQIVLDCLKDKQKEWVKNASHVAIVISRNIELYKGKFNEWADYDTGSAAISMALQAADLGLMAHQIGGFDIAKIIQDFHLPEHFKPLTIMVLGYEVLEPSPEKPRDRRPIGENFFFGKWDVPYSIQ